MKTGLLSVESTLFVVIDVQEKLVPVVNEKQRLLKNISKLAHGAGILGASLLVTEQYPQGLGHTHTELSLPAEHKILEKISFSCLKAEGMDDHLAGKKSLVLCGVEAHICVLKTALDAVEAGYDVHVVADAISSRSAHNKALAMSRMRQTGVYVTSVEMILFMLMEQAGNDTFKQISKLIK